MKKNPESLFARFRDERDTAALAEVFDLVAPRILRHAYRLARDPAEAEDLLQATFVTAIEAVQKYDSARPLVPWLFGILQNHARRAARLRRRDAQTPPSRLRVWPDPSDVAERKELGAAVAEGLRELPEPYRRVVRLNLIGGLKPHEIAKLVDKPAATIRTQLHRGLHMLRRSLPFAVALLLSARPTLAAVRASVLTAASKANWPRRLAAPVVGALIVASVVMTAAVGAGAASAREAITRTMPVSAAPDATARTVPRSATATTRSPSPDAPARPNAEPRLRVRVVHADGAPATDVRVEARGLGRGRVPHFRVTDRTGTATFEALGSPNVILNVDRGLERKTRLKNDADTLERFILPRGVDVEGIVLDAAGAPLSGAGITVSEWETQPRGPFVVRTDASGRFRLRALPPGSFLSARHRDHAPSMPVEVTSRHTSLRLRLPGPGGSIRGTVTGPAGRPVPGALVYAGAPPGASSAPAAVRTHADENGVFVVEGLPTGPVPVTVCVDGFVPCRTRVDIVASRVQVVQARLENGLELVGTIRDDLGRPIHGAVVMIDDYNAFHSFWVATKKDGGYRIGPLAPGPTVVLVLGGEKGRLLERIELPLAPTFRWDGVLVESDVIFGRLVDDHRKPCANLTVTVKPAGKKQGARTTRTDEQGSFRFDGCAVRLYDIIARDAKGREVPIRCQQTVYPADVPLLLQCNMRRE